MVEALENVKESLSIQDTKQDKILNRIIERTESRLSVLLPIGVNSVPSELNYIVEEVSIKRYNRIGAEGMTSESVDGRSNTFQANDFDEYMEDIARFYPTDSSNRKGRGVFY
ncbi:MULTISPECIES: phage head-tail connector protein [Staphylococcus]|uniref:phage head-tail connector protein n=1 Tax=Staphylococcus TaxID=1279 RepID=UPI0011A518DA|nr:phage head-tail connector protein [Staphylococcus saprophyticus]MDW3787309.1 phage head-tail connector protein [Staphylococcus saprophyticus]MDW3925715.1 phage head-tail connector protein [Staphylococcus saprophyticus]MDW3954953.1 phage head-tail connector protein [Staphylococcus saprophyticus]MDW4148537.1 phage head-tail connector protein [Staphylococcus saprophyticus]